MAHGWLIFLWIILRLHSVVFCAAHTQYKMILFAMEDQNISPLPTSNKIVLLKENITLLAQVTPVDGHNDSANTGLVEHLFWLGAVPHITLISHSRTVHMPFRMELYRNGGLLAWQLDIQSSNLNPRNSAAGDNQWDAELSLSQGSGFLSTRATVTDAHFVPWMRWQWPDAVSDSVVAPRVRQLRYLQESCGADLGLLYAVTTVDAPGVYLAVVAGTGVKWYDFGRLRGLRKALGASADNLDDLSLESAALTPSHLLLFTSHGLLVSADFTEATSLHDLNFTKVDLSRTHTPASSESSQSKAVRSDELVHTPSCFSTRNFDEKVLLLLHSERLYLMGEAPFYRDSCWTDIKQLVSWPSGLTNVRDIRYSWHWGVLLVGYEKGDRYETLALRLDRAKHQPLVASSLKMSRPYVHLCSLTNKIYLLSDRVYASLDSGATFEQAPSNVTFDTVKYCATDLINRHVCITSSKQLLILSLATDAPSMVDLGSVININATDVKKTALVVDRAGGVTVIATGPTGFTAQHFQLGANLAKHQVTCEHQLQLLGGVRHMSYIYLDVHDIVTVEVEAHRVHSHGEAAATKMPFVDLELSHPDIVQVEQRSSLHNSTVRYTATARPRSWRLRGVSAMVFRLPLASALCPDTARLVNLAMRRTSDLSVHVHWPAAQQQRVQTDSDALYQLPVNYRPPSDMGVNIPTSENIYNADPSQPINKALWVVHDISRHTGRFKACAGKARRADCDCPKARQLSSDVNDTDCRAHVAKFSWPAKLRLTVRVREALRDDRPLQAPMYVIISELNNRSSWQNHARGKAIAIRVDMKRQLSIKDLFSKNRAKVLLGPDLAYIYYRNLSAYDRHLVDPQRIRILMTGTGLYHFRIQVAKHTSYNVLYDDVLLYVVPARLMSQVQNVVYPLVGISLIVLLFVVFEYYHQRSARVDQEFSDSGMESSSQNS